MTEERKADVDAALAELEFEIALAIKQGLIHEDFQWMATIDVSGRALWIAALTVGEVKEKPHVASPA